MGTGTYHAPHQVEAVVCKRLLQRISHLQSQSQEQQGNPDKSTAHSAGLSWHCSQGSGLNCAATCRDHEPRPTIPSLLWLRQQTTLGRHPTWNLHLSPKPAAALSSFARAACTGLSVMPCAVHPNLRLM
jgi:hypothetical protein